MSFQNPVFIPGPTNIPERLRKACDMPTIDHRSPLFGQILHPAREGVRKVLKSDSAEVFIFPSTGTGGWETALTNCLSAGDTVLAHVSARMRAALPADSMIARIGGEEFLIALPDTSLSGVRHVADHLRRVVRDTAVPLPSGEGPVRVTISIGAALATPTTPRAQTDVGKLVAQADKALYGSKSGGRDTVTVCMRPAA